jgi:hypothetical protein
MTAPKKPGAKRAPAKKAAAKRAPAKRPTAARRRAAEEAAAQAAAAEVERDRQCLDLRRAGVAFDVIVEQMQYAGIEAAVSAYERALERTGQLSRQAQKALELDRLDRLQAILWTKALRGDTAAIDRLIKLGEARGRVAGPDRSVAGPVEAQTVAELEQLRKADTALAATARVLARCVDEAESAAGASQAARELRMTMATIRGLVLDDDFEGGSGEGGSVVPPSRLEQLRQQAATRGR